MILFQLYFECTIISFYHCLFGNLSPGLVWNFFFFFIHFSLAQNNADKHAFGLTKIKNAENAHQGHCQSQFNIGPIDKKRKIFFYEHYTKENDWTGLNWTAFLLVRLSKSRTSTGIPIW